MTPEDRLFYAIQEMVWAGKRAADIKAAVKEAYEEVLRRELADGTEEMKKWA